jgi:hypothetical protein
MTTPAKPTQPTPPQVYAAICDVAGAISKSGIAKDRKNTGQGYVFRGIDDVYNALAPILAAAKLCILPRVVSRTVTEGTTKSGSPLFYVVCMVEFDLVSGADGSMHTVATCGEAMDSADKATNKAMSAAYKYMAMQVFCIPTEGSDNDADAHSPEPAAKQRERPAEAAARRETHDPSWTGDQSRYFAKLADLGVSKSEADQITENQCTPRPSQMPQDRRDRFLAYLGTAAGQANVEAIRHPQPPQEP